MSGDERAATIPPEVERRLREYTQMLADDHIRLLRMRPLVLRRELALLLDRRRPLYEACCVSPRAYGYAVQFERLLRSSRSHPQGRQVAGHFEVLALAHDAVVVASTDRSDVDTHGPRRLVERAYPLAVRPFLRSGELKHLVQGLARSQGSRAVAIDTIGYDGETGRPREDRKPLLVETAFGEMEEDDRLPHKATVSFRTREEREVLRAAVGRDGAATLFQGPALPLVAEFILPFVAQYKSRASAYRIPSAATLGGLCALRLAFARAPFKGSREMRGLCDAIGCERGLNVTILHLNPYLHAQVMDFLSGGTLYLAVTDESSVYLLAGPVSGQQAVERVVGAVFRRFGEAEVETVSGIAGQGAHHA